MRGAFPSPSLYRAAVAAALRGWLNGRAAPGRRVCGAMPGLVPDEACDYLFKIILLGDSDVGKTCVVHRFHSGHFRERHHNTIGVDFSVRSLLLDGKKVKVSPAPRAWWLSRVYRGLGPCGTRDRKRAQSVDAFRGSTWMQRG